MSKAAKYKASKKRIDLFSGVRNADTFLRQLIAESEDFIFSRTSKTKMIKYKGVTYSYSERPLSFSILPLINLVRTEIESNYKKVAACPYSPNPFNVHYYNFSESLRNIDIDAGGYYEFKNVVEMDITGAYYRAALNLGFICKTTFDKCMKMPKQFRLRVLGAIATVKTVKYYIDGNVSKSEIKQSEILREAWFKICSYVDEALKTFQQCLKKNFLFYWVDGIYFTNFDDVSENVKEAGYNSDLEFILDELNKTFSFDWKIVNIDKFILLNRATHLEIQIFKNGKDQPKIFFPPMQQVKGYYLMDIKSQ